jgi:hypothetical protein
MITTTTHADVLNMLAAKTGTELVKVWKETEHMMTALKFNPAGKNRDAEWDAVIQTRQWLTKVMQTKMTYAEFCEVVGIPND